MRKITSPISRFIFTFVCFFSFFLSLSIDLVAVCVCDPSTGCIPQPCTDCACCLVQPTGPCPTPPGNTYLLRYTITGAHGAMTFIGNTLGLSKILCENNPGTSAADRTDAIGAFITTNSSDVLNNYVSATVANGSPGGTTIDWTLNNSSAILNIPVGSTILHAELIWSGSYGYYCDEATIGVSPSCILTPASNVPVKLTTPDNVIHPVLADPATAMESQNPAITNYCAGNYVRSQDVTAILSGLANPNGTYSVGGVPATISAADNTHNAAGWTLAVIYVNNAITDVNNMTLFISNQQASTGNTPAEISGFCAAPATAGPSARLLLSAIETDANKMGDQMLFGATNPPTNVLSGPNNPANNFFASQINGDNGLLVTTGTYGTLNGVVSGPTGSNSNPNTGALSNQGRQGYDITNIDISAFIAPGQMTAFARATTQGDDYMINALGIQISVDAPSIVPIKKVNGQDNIIANIGDTVTFSTVINNTGEGQGEDVIFQDTLESGLVFVPGTFTVTQGLGPPVILPVTQTDIANGINLGIVPAAPDPNSMVTVTFDVQIVAPPMSGNVFFNQATTPFSYTACDQPIDSFNFSNIVSITLPFIPPPPPPTSLVGKIKKCKFLNENKYSVTFTWTPSPQLNIISYLIFNDGVLVASIPGTGPFIFETCLRSKSEANKFSIIAVNPDGQLSVPLNN